MTRTLFRRAAFTAAMPDNHTLKLLATHSRTLALAASTIADRDKYLDMAAKLDAEADTPRSPAAFDDRATIDDHAG